MTMSVTPPATRSAMNAEDSAAAGRVTAIRWYLKKAARKSIAMGSYATRHTTSPKAGCGPRLRVLTYHRFGESVRDPYCVTPPDFDRQMAYLAESGCAVSLRDTEAFLEGRKTLRDGAVLVTIDDGFRSAHAVALPILRNYGIPAVAFITASLLGSGMSAHATKPRVMPPENYLSWQELHDLASAGVAIGSHAWTHRSLGRMTLSEASDEAVRSRETLERGLGQAITAFAYPFGTRADFNPGTAAALRQSGYTCAFTAQHGALRIGMDVFELPRVKVEAGENQWMFRMLVRGGLDNWRWVDRTLWRFQVAGP
jgi:peptidoglycan/xylan/chitin deacetylase (PgdA/CDA1 family)